MAEKPQNTPSSIEPTMIRKVLQQAHRDKALAAMSGCLYFSSSSSSLSPGQESRRRSIRRSVSRSRSRCWRGRTRSSNSGCSCGPALVRVVAFS